MMILSVCLLSEFGPGHRLFGELPREFIYDLAAQAAYRRASKFYVDMLRDLHEAA